MRERSCCRCSLCRIENKLLADFREGDPQDGCRLLLASSPELALFSGVGPLLAHLRLCRDTSASDDILHALLRAKDIFCNGLVEGLFVLAFLPPMHSSLRQVARRYPQLSQEDASQQALHTLLHFLNSEQLRARPSYLGYAIARRLKRATFEWAERETRSRHFEAVTDSARNILDCQPCGDSFERIAFLRHFLDGAVRRGVLSEPELHLLVQFKLENGAGDALPDGSSNAHRQRLKRLLSKLRRLAATRG
jgi:hypothetical protein